MLEQVDLEKLNEALDKTLGSTGGAVNEFVMKQVSEVNEQNNRLEQKVQQLEKRIEFLERMTGV